MVATHKPRLWAVAVRVGLITVLATLVTFAVGLFVGIASMALLNAIRGGGVNMANAYRHVALPAASVAMVIALVLGARNELLEYRNACAAYLHQHSRAA
jgi:hypothetical protein